MEFIWKKDELVGTRDAYGKKLASLAKIHPEIVVLDADLSGSTKTALFAKQAPERFFNCGVAEQDMMGTAAGLATCGLTVFASTFAVFAAGRALEIVRQSVAYPKLNVKICPTHAGITVGEDGASHQMIEDISNMRTLPNMKVFVPADAYQTVSIIDHMVKTTGPMYLRLGRMNVPVIFDDTYCFEEGKGTILCEGNQVCLFVTGFVTKACLDAAKILTNKGISTSVVNLASIKPIDEDLIVKMAEGHKILFSVEEHSIIGGLGSAVAEVLCERCPQKLIRLGMRDEFGQSGPAKDLLKHYRLDAEGIADQVLEIL